MEQLEHGDLVCQKRAISCIRTVFFGAAPDASSSAYGAAAAVPES